MEVHRDEEGRLPVPAPQVVPRAEPRAGLYATPPEPEPTLIDVLVLDDSRFDAMQLQRECRSTELPVRVTIATGLEEFRRLLHQRRYHVVFVDYILPDGDGLAAQEIVKAEELNGMAPVVMISGEARHDIAVEAIRRGCIDYRAKSDLNRDALKGLILRALEEGSKLAQATLQRALEVQREEIVSSIREILREELRLGQTGHHDSSATTLQLLRSYGLVPESSPQSWSDLMEEEPDPQFVFRKH